MNKKLLYGFVVSACLISSVCLPSDNNKKRKPEEQKSSSKYKTAKKEDYPVNAAGYTPLHVIVVSVLEKSVQDIRLEVYQCADEGVPFSTRVRPVQGFSIVDRIDVGLTARDIAERDMDAAQKRHSAKYRAFLNAHDEVLAARRQALYEWVLHESPVLHEKLHEKGLIPHIMAFLIEQPKAKRSDAVAGSVLGKKK